MRPITGRPCESQSKIAVAPVAQIITRRGAGTRGASRGMMKRVRRLPTPMRKVRR
jgi:hypothetical protein